MLLGWLNWVGWDGYNANGWEIGKCTEVHVAVRKERNHLADTGVDGKVMLQFILMKLCMGAWCGGGGGGLGTFFRLILKK
jgi:hypothetical protein